MGDIVRRGGLVRGPNLQVFLVLLVLLIAFVPTASAVKVTLSADASVLLGDNVTLTVSASECLTSAAGHSTCTQAILVVDGVVMNKTLTKGASVTLQIPTAGSVAVSPKCGNATQDGIICITQPGAYKAYVWMVNDTISDATNLTLTTLSGVSGDTIANNPPDASAAFFVGLHTFTANLSRDTIVAGESVSLTGAAKGTPTVGAWVFDKGGNLENGRCYYRGLSPDGGGAFSWNLDRSIIASPGDYTIFVMFPGSDGIYNKAVPATAAPPFHTIDGKCAAALAGGGPQVLSTLQGQVDPLRTDDAFRTFKLTVDRPFLRLDPVALAFLNDTLTVSGRTNSPSGTVLVTVTRPFFEEQQTVTVTGSAFSVSFDTSVSSTASRPWGPGNYTVRALDSEGKEGIMTVELVEKRPAEFKVDNLVVFFKDGTAMDGKAPTIGQELTASAVLINRGENEGSVTLYFQLSGRTLCAPSTTLKAGQYALVNCTFTVNHSGAYTLQADGKSIALNVGGPKLPEVAGEVKPISSLPSGAHARLLFSGAVDQVVIQARSPVTGAQVAVQSLDERPEGAGAPPGTPFRYFRLSSVNMPDAAVGSMNVVFRVDGGWLAEKKLGAGSVRLYRLAASPQGVAAWRVEPEISRLGTDGRADGAQDVVYQSKVTAFGDFAVVGGSTEGAIAVPGQGGPLDILTNIPVMAAVAAGAGFAVFAYRKGWLDRLLRRKKVAPEEGAPGAALTEGAAAALPQTYEDEVFSLFRSGQMAQAFRRIFDEVSAPLKASMGVEGTFSSGELLREAEGKGLDPMLLTTLGQLFATCDAARFSGIPPTEEHLKWAMRAARSVFARLSGGGAALPASTGGDAVAPPAEPGYTGGDPGAGAPTGFDPQVPPGPPEGGFEAADLPPEADAPPGNQEPENGNGSRRRRRRRGGDGGNGNGNGNGHRGSGSGDGNGNGNHGNKKNGNGNGDHYSARGLLPPAGSPANGNGRHAPPSYYLPTPAGWAVGTARPAPVAPGPALSAYANFQKSLFPEFAQGPPPSPAPIPPLSPRPTAAPGANGTNGHGTNGTSGHGTNGTNGHGTNGHGNSGSNGYAGKVHVRPATIQRSRIVALPDVSRLTASKVSPPSGRGDRGNSVAPLHPPSERAEIPGIGGRTPTLNGSGAFGSASPSPPPPSHSVAGGEGTESPPPRPQARPPSPATRKRHRSISNYAPSPYPFTREEDHT